MQPDFIELAMGDWGADTVVQRHRLTLDAMKCLIRCHLGQLRKKQRFAHAKKNRQRYASHEEAYELAALPWQYPLPDLPL
jgi:hypothetical protein